MQNERIFTKELPYVGSLSGLVTVPPDFDETDDPLPVIVFLHGIGERGDGEDALPALRRHGVPKLFCADPAWGGVRAVTVSPQCPTGTTWERIVLPLMDYIDAAVSAFRGDPARVTVTGLSLGGFGAWALLAAFPERFAAAAPVCGGGSATWKNPDAMKGKPVRVFHSIDDDAVPYELDLAAARRALAAGADISFTTYCGLGHNCWDTAYERTDLIPWLASF